MAKTSGSSVDWFFVMMAALFGKAWNEIYRPKHTRFIKRAKAEWAGVIGDYDREFVRRVAESVRQQSSVPPSETQFWSLLLAERARVEMQNPKPPPCRETGKAGLAAVKACLNSGGG